MANGYKTGGRKKGTPNKTTTLLKEAILLAAEQAGDAVGNDGLVSFLLKQANENPTAFMTLLGKVLPLQVAGDPDDPISITYTIGGDDYLSLEELHPITGKS